MLGRFDSVPPASFDRMYRVNLRAPFVLTQGLLPALRRARGQVVFVNSSAGSGRRRTMRSTPRPSTD